MKKSQEIQSEKLGILTRMWKHVFRTWKGARPATITIGSESSVPCKPQREIIAPNQALTQEQRGNAIIPEAPVTPMAPTRPDPDRAAFRVLLADDTEINRQLVRILLRKWGCSVDVAENGLQAVNACAHQRYDLVLMDCLMPVMDGYEATRHLRAKESETGRARVPIIAITANTIDGERDRCTAAGMDDYLVKPFTATEFNSTIERWLKNPVHYRIIA